jgi:hypothetical protein
VQLLVAEPSTARHRGVDDDLGDCGVVGDQHPQHLEDVHRVGRQGHEEVRYLGRTVRPRFGQRGEDVGGCDQPGGERQIARCDAAVVAGAVATFVMTRCIDREGRRRGAALQHPGGPVAVQSHPLPVGRTQRARPIPHLARDRHPSQVVYECRRPHHFVVHVAEQESRRGREVGDLGGMPEQPAAFQVGDRGQRDAEPIQVVKRNPCRWARLGSDDGCEQIRLIQCAQQRLAGGTERGRQVGIELTAGPAAYLGHCHRQAASSMRQYGLFGHMDDAGVYRQGVAGAAGWDAGTVPAVVDLVQCGDGDGLETQLRAERTADLAAGSRCLRANGRRRVEEPLRENRLTIETDPHSELGHLRPQDLRSGGVEHFQHGLERDIVDEHRGVL